MEYAGSLTLREVIDEGVSEADSWRILRQLLSAMQYFTSLQIIHRTFSCVAFVVQIALVLLCAAEG